MPARETGPQATLPCPTCARPLTIYQPTGPDDRRQSRLQCETPTCPQALDDMGALGAIGALW